MHAAKLQIKAKINISTFSLFENCHGLLNQGLMFRQSNIHLLDFSFVSLLTFLDDFIKCLKAVFYVEARFDNDG